MTSVFLPPTRFITAHEVIASLWVVGTQQRSDDSPHQGPGLGSSSMRLWLCNPFVKNVEAPPTMNVHLFVSYIHTLQHCYIRYVIHGIPE